jgi:hypothetical protein
MPTVKCATCGFLAVRNQNGSGALEATDDIRKTGVLSQGPGSPINAAFFCRVQSSAFPSLVNDPIRTQLNAMDPADPAVVNVKALNEDRACDKYRLWEPSKTPEKHEEMAILEQMRAETAAFRRETERTEERRHQEMFAWQEKVEKNVERRHWSSLLIQFLLALFAAIVALIGAKLLPSWSK